jgi:hypothetical protein
MILRVLLTIFTLLFPLQSHAEVSVLFDSGEIEQSNTESSQIRWLAIFIPRAMLEVRNVDSSKIFTDKSVLKGYCPESDVIISGGFYDRSPNRPNGLVIEAGKIISQPVKKTSGGFVYTINNRVVFSKIGDLPPNGTDSALQGLPFLIENGKVAVRKRKDAKWNRIAIGNATLNDVSGLAIFSAISPSAIAVQQHVFTDEIIKIAKDNKLNLDMVLNLDGSGSPFVHVRQHNIISGNPRKIYMPNIICLGERD